MIHLHHSVPGLESLAGQDGPQDGSCTGVGSRTGQLTGMAPHAALGVDQDERTFYGHDIHLLRKGIVPSILKKPGSFRRYSLLTVRFPHPGIPKKCAIQMACRRCRISASVWMILQSILTSSDNSQYLFC
jgi:hypothetical protein